MIISRKQSARQFPEQALGKGKEYGSEDFTLPNFIHDDIINFSIFSVTSEVIVDL